MDCKQAVLLRTQLKVKTGPILEQLNRRRAQCILLIHDILYNTICNDDLMIENLLIIFVGLKLLLVLNILSLMAQICLSCVLFRAVYRIESAGIFRPGDSQIENLQIRQCEQYISLPMNFKQPPTQNSSSRHHQSVNFGGDNQLQIYLSQQTVWWNSSKIELSCVISTPHQSGDNKPRDKTFLEFLKNASRRKNTDEATVREQ